MAQFMSTNLFESAVVEELEMRMKRTEELWLKFSEVHEEIVMITVTTDEDAVGLNSDILVRTEEKYLSIMSHLQRKINELRKAAEVEPSADGLLHAQDANDSSAEESARPSGGDQATQSSVPHVEIQGARHANFSVSVPNSPISSRSRRSGYQFTPQQLPKFSGDYAAWPTFHSLYLELVHNEAELSPTAKFNVLLQHLVGDAASTIAGIHPSDKSYEVAWRLVVEMYDKPRLILQALLQTLQRLRPLTDENTAALRAVVTKFKQVAGQLSSIPGMDIKSWSPFIVFQLAGLLDRETRRSWELEYANHDDWTLTDMFRFLEHRMNSLQMVQQAMRTPSAAGARTAHSHGSSASRSTNAGAAASRPPLRSVAVVVGNESVPKCPTCKKGRHLVEDCPEFLALNTYPRSQRAKQSAICFCCLKQGCSTSTCPLAEICKYCDKQRRHHRLLCFTYCDSLKEQAVENVAPTVAFVRGGLKSAAFRPPTNQRGNNTNMPAKSAAELLGGVLLATALVRIRAASGEYLIARALCDTGAQANLITQACFDRLQLKRQGTDALINPVGEAGGLRARGVAQLELEPYYPDQANQYRLTTGALIVSRITGGLPEKQIDIGYWPTDVRSHLADPMLQVPDRIDILLGAHVWSAIALPIIRKSTENQLMAQASRFGWLVFGGLDQPFEPIVGCVASAKLPDGNWASTVAKFWQSEAAPGRHQRTAQEELCEEIFARGVRRSATGRYIVPIPIDPSAAPLGSSRAAAYQRYRQLEIRFQRSPVFRQKYVQFMFDYEVQGHMSQMTTPIDENQPHYYIPHHGIDTGKFRVVFDGSAVTASGQSFNDVQLLGERRQGNLVDRIMSFRTKKVGMTADIKQMYRQVLVDESQHCMQLIFWRPTQNEPIRTFALNTVTYGMRYAPHSAIRALQQCAMDYQQQYPKASAVVLRDFYMDDLLTGADNNTEAEEMFHDLVNLTNMGHFPLCKWTTNDWELMSVIDASGTASSQPLLLTDEENCSVLGVVWNPAGDTLQYAVKLADDYRGATKRAITSQVAKLFDPTGLVAPVVLTGKLFIREAHATTTGWDEKMEPQWEARWNEFRTSLKALENCRIPRWIGKTASTRVELHGFCGASAVAHAAAIYYRIEQPFGPIKCGILTAKTKIAPTKAPAVTRLELAGALLLIQLMATVIEATGEGNASTHYWCGSAVALHWIKQPAQQWQAFVAKRVGEIQSSSAADDWGYVPANENPAAIAASGLAPPEIVDNQLWWQGPQWLCAPSCDWPKEFPILSSEQEAETAKEAKAVTVAVVQQPVYWLEDKYSDFNSLCLVTAKVLRFINNCRVAVQRRRNGEAVAQAAAEWNPITRTEWEAAEAVWFGRMQKRAFSAELKACERGRNLPKKSRLSGMMPFVGEDGLLRVGGRLQNAKIPYQAQHPIIVPGDDILSEMLLRWYHMISMHGGPALMTRILRTRLWMTGGRDVIRRFVQRCVICARHRAETLTQQMAPLDARRVNFEYPFAHVSVDYCGHFDVRRYSGKCNSTQMCYVAVFVCLATRAIHLEVVEDLTTDAFLDAYQRFASRRGHCRSITSDNATNFVGAKRHLYNVVNDWRKCANNALFTTRGIEWRFIMPKAPSQGGNHESAVKLFKHHLRRMVGSNFLSINEFRSLTIRIEACLNSRPLEVQSQDPNEHTVITPAHFLIGREFENVAVDPIMDDSAIGSYAVRWRKVQQLHQHFWRQWQRGYLNALQSRNKWREPQNNLAIGDVVLIKEDRQPPQQWLLGRVNAVHPGKDGLVRNVTLRSAGKIFQRAAQGLVKLPVGNSPRP